MMLNLQIRENGNHYLKAYAFLMLLSLVVTPIALADTLTWQDAVAETSRNNSALESARQSFLSSDDQVRASYGAFLPEISANLGYSRGNTGASSSSGASSTIVSGVDRIRSSYTAGVSARENLFSGFSSAASLEQSQANLELSSASLDLARSQLSYSLKSAFAGLLYAQEAVKLNRSIEKRRTDNMRLVELRFQGGRENRGSSLLSKATASQARYDVTQAEANLEIARQVFAQVLGRDESEELTVRGAIPEKVPAKSIDLRAITTSTPEYQQQVAKVGAAEARVKSARSGFFPSLDLTGAVNRVDNRFFPKNDRWSLGLGLSIPIFSGGQDYYSTKSASRQAASANATRSDTARQISTGLRQAWTAYRLAVQKLQVDADFAEASTVRAEIARNKYDNGLLSFEDWDIIENDLISRQKAQLQSGRDRSVAEAAWEQAQGKGVIE